MLPALTARFSPVFLLMVACGGAADGLEPDREQLALHGGTASGPEDDGVVRFESVTAGGVSQTCTGTMVADNLLVTARHCVANYFLGNFECNVSGELTSPGEFGKQGALVAPGSISVYLEGSDTAAAVGIDLKSTDATSLCRDDIAFVVLDRALPLPIRPIRVFDPIPVDELATVVGFGSGSRLRLSGMPVLSVGPDQPDPSDTSLTPPRSFALGPSLCTGDSGAPALSQTTGAVLGVGSFFAATTCELPEALSFFVQVRAQRTLVGEAFEAAGQKPWYEGASAPGTECTDCESSGCAVASRRARLSSTAAWLLFVALVLKTRRSAPC